MNILIKLSCLVGLAIAPILGEHAAKNQPVVPQGINMPAPQNYQPQINMSQPVQPADMQQGRPTMTPPAGSSNTGVGSPTGTAPTSSPAPAGAGSTAPGELSTSPPGTNRPNTQPPTPKTDGKPKEKQKKQY